MEKQYQQKPLLQILLLAAISLFFVVACSQEAPTEHQTSIVSDQDFQPYSHEGLNLKHPPHWTLVYDESPSLYADRGVAFDASESSRIRILFYKDRPLSYSNIANQIAREFRLDSNEHVKNYRREPIKIGEFNGLRLTWQDTMIGTTAVEITILTIIDSPNPVFVEFQLHNEDITKESPHIAPFIKSISIQ